MISLGKIIFFLASNIIFLQPWKSQSFFLPKLSNKEKALVAEKNEEYLKSFQYYPDENPDVENEEMKRSNSKDKYLHAECWRWVIPLNVDLKIMQENINASEKNYRKMERLCPSDYIVFNGKNWTKWIKLYENALSLSIVYSFALLAF